MPDFRSHMDKEYMDYNTLSRSKIADINKMGNRVTSHTRSFSAESRKRDLQAATGQKGWGKSEDNAADIASRTDAVPQRSSRGNIVAKWSCIPMVARVRMANQD
jgi:hypothetical protein